MNEPYLQTAAEWQASAVAAVNAIRIKTGSMQIINVQGTAWTGSDDWLSSWNAAAWDGYKDPVGAPFFFEMHQYLDAYSTGIGPTCAAGKGSSVLAVATQWAPVKTGGNPRHPGSLSKNRRITSSLFQRRL